MTVIGKCRNRATPKIFTNASKGRKEVNRRMIFLFLGALLISSPGLRSSQAEQSVNRPSGSMVHVVITDMASRKTLTCDEA
jgi:hypothetical protein